jgi:hypothetical protein
MLGLSTGEVCGFVSVVSCLALRSGTVIASSGFSPGVLFSEVGAFIERLGYTAERRCEAFGGLPGTICCVQSEALAFGRPALVSGLLSARSRCVASLALLEPTQALALSLRLLLVSCLLTLISRGLALIRDLFTVVGGSLSLIRDPFALIRDPFALIRDPFALIRGLLAHVGHPLALVGHPLGHRRISLLTTAPPLIPQPVTLALQGRIIGREPRRPAPNLPAEALNLGPRRFIGRLEGAGA